MRSVESLHLCILTLVLGLTEKTQAQTPPTFPKEDWPRVSQRESDAILRTPQCQDMLNYMGLGPQKGTLLSDGLAVIQNGTVLFSLSKAPFKEDTLHPIWSASKSVTSALIGASIERYGKDGLSLRSTVNSFLPNYSNVKADLARITIQNLLDMGSGIQWSESYSDGILNSSVIPMIYLSGYPDMAQFVSQHAMTKEGAGGIYNYSSGDMSLLLASLKGFCDKGSCDYANLPWSLLFDRIGIKKENAVFERDQAGVFVGSSYVFLGLLDMARVGYLYLHDGVWNEDRILPEGWVRDTVTPNEVWKNENSVIDDMVADGVYGRTWWLNTPGSQSGKASIAKLNSPSYPNFPDDMYAALGHYGQWIIVIPSRNMVIVRTGNDLSYNDKISAAAGHIGECVGQFRDSSFTVHTQGNIQAQNVRFDFKPFEKREFSQEETKLPSPEKKERDNGLDELRAKLAKGSDITKTVGYVLEKGVLTSLFAKEGCSCVFVSKLPWDVCLERNNVAISKALVTFDVIDKPSEKSVTSAGKKPEILVEQLEKIHTPTFVAAYDTTHRYYGCTMSGVKP